MLYLLTNKAKVALLTFVRNNMAQIKKDAKIISMKLDKGIYAKLEQFCNETGLSKTSATEKILDHYLTEYFGQPESKRGLFK